MKPVEFLPERIREQRQRRRRLIRQGYLLAVCLLALVALTYIRQARLTYARAEMGGLEERARNLQRQVEMIAPLEQQMADLLIKKRIEDELGSRIDCSVLLAELCRITPPNMSLVSLELKQVDVPDGAEPTAGGRAAAPGRNTVRRVHLVLTGLAPTDVDLANFIGQLSASCLLEDVNMGYARTATFRERTAREFQASCYLAR